MSFGIHSGNAGCSHGSDARVSRRVLDGCLIASSPPWQWPLSSQQYRARLGMAQVSLAG